MSSALPTLILYMRLPPLSNILAVLALYLTIGLLHLDGLADWADGIMVKGDRERKVRAMKDLNTGIAGVFAVVTVLLLQVYALPLPPVLRSLPGGAELQVRHPLGNGNQKTPSETV